MPIINTKQAVTNTEVISSVFANSGKPSDFSKTASAKGSDFEGRWQERLPVIAWGTIALFLGVLSGYAGTFYLALSGQLSYMFAAPILGILAFASFTVMHDAGHGSIVQMGSRFKFAETAIGWISSLPFLFVPFRSFQRIHDRHHAFTNDPERDPDYFNFGERWYQVVINSFAVPFRYHVLMFTKLRHIKAIRETFLSTFVYFTLVWSVVVSLALSGYAMEVLCLSLLPTAMAVFLLAMFFDYIPHHPQNSLDPYLSTRMFPSAFLNVLLFGQNYHLIHHLYPRLPWYQYQGLYRQIGPELAKKGAPIEDVLGRDKPALFQSDEAKWLKSEDRSMKRVFSVASIERECQDAVYISFDLPAGQTLDYQPGQYLVVSKWLEGQSVSRCYSLCSAPGSTQLKIGVRAVPDGQLSNYLNQELKAGDELVLEGPYGEFRYPPVAQLEHQQLLLFAGGSGITPILSIIETVLQHSGTSDRSGMPKIKLWYINRSPSSTMFLQRLTALSAEYPEHFQLYLGYSSEQREDENTLFNDEPTMLAHLQSVLDQKNDSAKAKMTHSLCYVCGPDQLKVSVKQQMMELGLAAECFFQEDYQTDVQAPMGQRYQVTVATAAGKFELEVAENQTILEVAKQKNIPLSYACESGSCGSCKCRIESGQIAELGKRVSGVSDIEIKQGFTLACQAKPRSDLRLSETP